jgi:DNA-binding XRE family transcriptional regulator
MTPVEENRRSWLLALIEKYGTLANLNVALGRRRTDATLSIIKNAWLNPATGKASVMSHGHARRIETALGLKGGVFDTPFDSARTRVLNSLDDLPPMVRREERTSFGERLQSARLEKGFSQMQLAELSGVSRLTIAQAEIGRNCPAKWISSLAEVLEVDPYWLAEGKRGKAPAQKVR